MSKFLWSLFAGLILGGCDFKALVKSSSKSSEDRNVSLFASYSGQYCEITDQAGNRSIRANCENLRLLTDPESMPCKMQGEWQPKLAYFPSQSQAMSLCQKFDRPDRKQKKLVRFMVLGDNGGDTGTTINADQRRVAQAMAAVCPPASSGRSDSCDFAVILGDLVYPNGVRDVWDQKLLSRFSDTYKEFSGFDFYITLGNHDYMGNVEAMREYTWFSDRWRMPAHHYPIPELPEWLHIYAIDSMRAGGEFGGKNWDEQKAAMTTHLCQKSGWKFLAGHYPPYSHGGHGSHAGTLARLNDLASSCPFHVYFGGHDHHQEHMNGPLYDVVVQGAGGAEIRDVATVVGGQEAETGVVQNFARSAFGFAVVEVSDTVLDMWFYDVGRWAYDNSG